MNADDKPEYLHSTSERERERFYMELGGRLRYVRQELYDLSPAKFAEIMPAGKSSVLRYESGERPADIWYIVCVASGKKVCLEWLLTGHGQISLESGISDEKGVYGEPGSDQERQQRLKAGTEYLLQSSSETQYNPPAVWSALIIELMTAYGLEPEGAGRIIETLAAIDHRNQS